MDANDQLSEYNCTEHYYRYGISGLIITDGVKALAEQFSCFWLIDIIVSYQPGLSTEDFQVWKLKRTGSSATVVCTDGNNNILCQQVIDFTDFIADTATIWIEHGTALLPSEH